MPDWNEDLYQQYLKVLGQRDEAIERLRFTQDALSILPSKIDFALADDYFERYGRDQKLEMRANLEYMRTYLSDGIEYIKEGLAQIESNA